MITWDINEFYGIIPRLQGKLQPHGVASTALDVDLTHGTLKAFFEPKRISAKTGISFYLWGCDFYTWTKCVEASEWLPDCPRLFITGRVNYPEVAVRHKTGLVYRRLGVPVPPSPIKATASEKQTDKAREVSYVATFVNYFDEEGMPSPPSNSVLIEDGDAVTLQFNYTVPLEYDVKYVNIYRMESGFRTGDEKEQELLSHYYLVASLPIYAVGHTDTLSVVDVGRGLVSQEYREPPHHLRNITLIHNTAQLVGSVHNKLYFSENLLSHSFPIEQELTLDDNISAISQYNGRLYVLTDGHPYRIDATTNCTKRECREVYRYSQGLPLIACHTGSGVVETPYGVVYASSQGLVLLDGEPIILTSELFSIDDWQLLEPHTTRLAYYQGALFIVTNKASFILWLDDKAYADTKYKKLVAISDRPISMLTSRQGELLLLNEDGIYQWNASNTRRPFVWVSEDIDAEFAYPLLRIRADVADNHVDISRISPIDTVARTFITGITTLPYPRNGRHKQYNIKVVGIGEVREIACGIHEIDLNERGKR